MKAVEHTKLELTLIDDAARTEPQKAHAGFFRSRGSSHLLTAAIGHSIETVLGRAVADRFALRFIQNCTPSAALVKWVPVVKTGLAYSAQLLDPTNLGLKSPERVAEAMQKFSSMMEATRAVSSATFDSFGVMVESRGPQA